MSDESGSEDRKLRMSLKFAEAHGRLDHVAVTHRRAIFPFRHRLTFQVTHRIMPIMFPATLVQASEQ